MDNQRIIAAAAAAAAAAEAAAAAAAAVAAAAVAPGRIKAHARGQMMTRVLLWGGMLPWINVRKGGNQRIIAHAAASAHAAAAHARGQMGNQRIIAAVVAAAVAPGINAC
jgi:hypothetical protein